MSARIKIPKIVQVIPTTHPSYGGPAVGAVALHLALRNCGARAVLLSANYGSPADESLRYTDDHRVYRASRPYRLESSWGLFRAIWREVKTADLVHLHGQYLLPHIVGYACARVRGVPYGVQVHGTLEPYQRAESKRKKAVYNSLVGTRILRGAMYVHFAADSEAVRAQDVVPAEKALVVPLGASLAANPRPPRGLRETGLADRERVVLFLGRLAKKKRPDVLIRAWAQIDRPPSATLVIAGPDEDFTKDGLETLADSLGCSASVRVIGPVGAEEAAWLYARSGLFVLPSENENFAIAVAEAMLAGCKVITTPHVAAHEHVLASRCGEVIALDSEALARSLGAGLASPEATRAAGARGHSYARAQLSWERFARELVSVASRARAN